MRKIVDNAYNPHEQKLYRCQYKKLTLSFIREFLVVFKGQKHGDLAFSQTKSLICNLEFLV
jgi:hypothetical protein